MIVLINTLHKEFEYVTSGLLRQAGEKSISEIHSILLLAKVKLLSKKTIRTITKLMYMSKNNNQKHKAMPTSDNEYFNYHKIGYFGLDCRMPDYRLLKKKNIGNAKQN